MNTIREMNKTWWRLGSVWFAITMMGGVFLALFFVFHEQIMRMPLEAAFIIGEGLSRLPIDFTILAPVIFCMAFFFFLIVVPFLVGFAIPLRWLLHVSIGDLRVVLLGRDGAMLVPCWKYSIAIARDYVNEAFIYSVKFWLLYLVVSTVSVVLAVRNSVFSHEDLRENMEYELPLFVYISLLTLALIFAFRKTMHRQFRIFRIGFVPRDTEMPLQNDDD